MGYVGSRMRRLEDPQVASAVGHCAGHEEAPRPALDVRGPLADRHAVLGAVDAGDGLAADYNGTGLLAGGSQFRVRAARQTIRPGRNIRPFGQMVRPSR